MADDRLILSSPHFSPIYCLGLLAVLCLLSGVQFLLYVSPAQNANFQFNLRQFSLMSEILNFRHPFILCLSSITHVYISKPKGFDQNAKGKGVETFIGLSQPCEDIKFLTEHFFYRNAPSLILLQKIHSETCAKRPPKGLGSCVCNRQVVSLDRNYFSC